MTVPELGDASSTQPAGQSSPPLTTRADTHTDADAEASPTRNAGTDHTPTQLARWLDYSAFPDIVDNIMASCTDHKTLLNIRACSRRMRAIADGVLLQHVFIEHLWVGEDAEITSFKSLDMFGRRIASMPQYYRGDFSALEGYDEVSNEATKRMNERTRKVRVLDHTVVADSNWGEHPLYSFTPDLVRLYVKPDSDLHRTSRDYESDFPWCLVTAPSIVRIAYNSGRVFEVPKCSGKIVLHFNSKTWDAHSIPTDDLPYYFWGTETILVVVLSDAAKSADDSEQQIELDGWICLIQYLHCLFKSARNAKFLASSIVCVDFEAALQRKYTQFPPAGATAASGQAPPLLELLSPSAWPNSGSEVANECTPEELEFELPSALSYLKSLVQEGILACPLLEAYKATLTDEQIRLELQPSRMMLKQLEEA
ncbi:uncharacterized protein LOC62_03G003657 [Vanrija pseudolonga]|uniref:F-box domain-containing protein n=1 Tax=Vanrija pseudolonga TaxID=143232 RepID=A0AAF1BKX5_9TREE|nr:hypothetical protein LOC62_03G003657 [Vanrija pseudolonga]